MSTNIHPTYDTLLQKEDKETLLKQRAKTLWLTGLSGSGKTTIARVLERELHEKGFATTVLDGDNIRAGICNNLGFSIEDRTENIRRIAEVSKLFNQAGIICINSFVSPTKEIRNLAKEIIGEDEFIEIYINTPIEVCEQRDVKGLYKKARAGEIKNFTGIDSPFEAPDQAIEIKTEGLTPEESAKVLLDRVMGEVSF